MSPEGQSPRENEVGNTGNDPETTRKIKDILRQPSVDEVRQSLQSPETPATGSLDSQFSRPALGHYQDTSQRPHSNPEVATPEDTLASDPESPAMADPEPTEPEPGDPA